MTIQSEQAPVNLWHVLQLRLTAFPIEAFAPENAKLFETVVGTAPEKVEITKLVRSEEGVYAESGLTCLVDPIRLQWQQFPIVDPANLPETFPSLGQLPKPVEGFSILMEKWLLSSPTMSRIAFGAVLHQPACSHDDAYAKLGAYLPSIKVDPESSDFEFRVNRRRCSQIAGLSDMRINRLMKWGATKWEMKVRARGPSGTAGQTLPSSEGYACRLELDVNTVPESISELPAQHLSAIWQELVELAMEIARQGDCK